ncbi:MAG TPA: glycogen debranching N-terminal domain-containing protein [Micromonosporaceae bacterium]|nr:glycogen debranching N-terminal domain-containing protein [Micromonosporaceae bacterium]
MTATGGGSGALTLIEGATFCLSDATGDIAAGSAHGLFAHDARVVSACQLRLDERRCESLALREFDAREAEFLLRRAPAPGTADSTLLVVRRRRMVTAGMRETVSLHNLSPDDTEAHLTIEFDADFTDLFAVKAGHAVDDRAPVETEPSAIVFRSESEPGRWTRIAATAAPEVTVSGLSWRVRVPARTIWSATIDVSAHSPDDPTAGDVAGVDRGVPAGFAVDGGGPHIIGNHPHIVAADPRMTHTFARSLEDLGSLRMTTGEGRAYVAAGAPWFMTLFGRDSQLTAWMTLPLDRELAMGTLRELADVQGRVVDHATEEEPGRILHEFRRGPAVHQALGGNRYYGSVDATPLFVMLLAEAERWGADRDAVAALLPAADAAMRWMDEYGDRDGDGFVEYHRTADHGLVNQGWKDSGDGINDAAGNLARLPIALCEVQGYAYAARQARAHLAETFGDPNAAAYWRARAAELREAFAAAYWLPERGYFAVALDGAKRPVDALTSNVGHLLWTGILSDEHAASTIAALAGSTMDSGFGLRTLASDMGAYNPMSYHNGSVWPHDTAMCIAGLMTYRHIEGAVALAHRLADGLFAAATAFDGRLPELYCGFPRDMFDPPVPYPTSCSPQAWASGAPLLVLRSLLGLEPAEGRDGVTVDPALPEWWGEISIEGVRVGDSSATVIAHDTYGAVRWHDEPHDEPQPVLD